MVLRCGCVSDKHGNKQAATFQDKRYGKGMRVHNKCTKNNQPMERCVICENEKQG